MSALKSFAKFAGMVALSIAAIALVFRFMPASVKTSVIGFFQIA